MGIKVKYTIIHAVSVGGRLGVHLTQAHRVKCEPSQLGAILRAIDPWFVFQGWPDFEDGSAPEMLDKEWCLKNTD